LNLVTGDADYNAVSGSGNTLNNATSYSLVSGQNNLVQGNHNVVGGRNNTLAVGVGNSQVMGTGNLLQQNTSYSSVFGVQNTLFNGADYNSVMGDRNQVRTANNVTLGDYNSVNGPAGQNGYNVAIGNNIDVNGQRNIAMGSMSTIDTGSDSIAMGTNAYTYGDGQVAIGSGARVEMSAPNSVALGAGSIADEEDTVSVGFDGGERRIQNVAKGQDDTDAVNVSQLKGTRDELRRGIAASIALVELMPSAPGETTVNLGWGHYKGEDAVGLTAVHRIRIEDWDHMMVNFCLAYGFHQSGAPLLRGGVTFMF
jgi:hypothetical protein